MHLYPGVIMLHPERIDEGDRDVKAVGLSPGNGMFVPVLTIFYKVNAAKRKGKIAAYQSFSFSTANVLLMLVSVRLELSRMPRSNQVYSSSHKSKRAEHN